MIRGVLQYSDKPNKDMRFRFLAISLLTLCSSGSTAEIGLWELRNYHEYSPKLASSGQPDRDQFSDIADAGVQYVINLAPASTADAIPDERDIVEALGMGYAHIPVDWDNPTLEDFQKFMSVIRANDEKTILVHCWLNSRASAFVYLRRILDKAANQETEFAVLREIWSANPGDEIENAPHWRQFLSRTLSEYPG